MPFTAREYAFLAPEHVAKFGLPPKDDGYGLFFVDDEDGHHWTVVCPDVGYWSMIVNGPGQALAGVELPADKFPAMVSGWPDEWVLEW